jgi:hypothetical protein
MPEIKRSIAAIVVLVARHPRAPKVRELTEDWDDESWAALCIQLANEKIGKSYMPERPLFILPDFEASQSDEKVSIHKSIRIFFKQRSLHANKSPIAVLSCFKKEGEVDKVLKRSFQIFLSIHGDQGKAFLMYLSDQENKVLEKLETE